MGRNEGRTILAWHFTGDTLRDGSPIPPVGKWLRYEGKIAICQSGFHASEHPFDALQYAPGPFLHRVKCRGIKEREADKFVCRERRIIASMDATEMLCYFARIQALSGEYLSDMPNIVLDYLMTGDDALRPAARAALRPRRGLGAARACVRERCPWNAAWEAVYEAGWEAGRAGDAEDVWEAAREDFRVLVHECFGEAK